MTGQVDLPIAAMICSVKQFDSLLRPNRNNSNIDSKPGKGHRLNKSFTSFKTGVMITNNQVNMLKRRIGLLISVFRIRYVTVLLISKGSNMFIPVAAKDL